MMSRFYSLLWDETQIWKKQVAREKSQGETREEEPDTLFWNINHPHVYQIANQYFFIVKYISMYYIEHIKICLYMKLEL